jgi:plasmid stabilization system protein ParE
LQSIRDYVAMGSPHYADLLANRIIDASERLRQFPRLGRVVPEFGHESVREIIVARYRLIYELEGDNARVLAVHHGARLLGSLGIE